MIRSTTATFLLIFILFFSNAKGQTFYYKNYTVDNGLPSTEIFHVIQDQKGFIWTATNQGVSRFDGYHFKNYDNLSGLPRNTILDLFEDNKGRIWFISLLGELSWFENDSIHIYPYNDLILEYNKGNYGRPMKQNFYADSLNNIYIGFNRKPLINISDDGVLTELIPKNDTCGQLFKILPNNNIVYSINNFNPTGIEIEDENMQCNIKGSYYFDSHVFVTYAGGKYLFASTDILNVADKSGEVTNYKFNRNIIWLSKDSENNIWIGLPWGGVKAFTNFNFEKEKFSILNNKSVSSVIRDFEGGYWFSTLENGLYYFPSLEIKSLTKEAGLKLKSVNQVEKQNNKIWFAGNSSELYFLEDEKLNINNSIYKDQDIYQCVFIKNYGEGIGFYFNGDKKGNLKILQNSKEIWSESRFSRGVVSLGKDSILLFFKGPKIINTNISARKRGIFNDKYTDIYTAIVKSKGVVWLGTDKGLFEFNISTKEIKELDFSPLLRKRINYMLKDQNNNVWFGTKGAGLLKYDGKTVVQITKRDGLPGNSINVIEKKDSILWLATNSGLGKVYLDKNGNYKKNKRFRGNKLVHKLQIEHFERSNGLINNEIYDIALDDNNVYVGTNNGLSYFNQQLSGNNTVAPPIYFTKVKVMGKDTVLKDNYELKYNQNYIEFGFVGISYKREKPIRYAFMLEGVDRDWEITENQTVQYPLLPPGEYVFKVKAFNRSGLESEKIQTISFNISEAYYQTTWFKVLIYILSLLLVLMLFGVYFFIKMREVKKRNMVTEELNKFRQRALSAQMNPHFIYNSLNSVQSYILKNDREKSSNYLSKFGSLMRRILDNSQNPVITLEEELEALKVYIEMELIRFRNSFSFHLNIDEKIDVENIKVPPLIIQPYVENAIHHGLRLKEGERNLWINITKLDNKICIVIEDDGVGRKEAFQIRQKSQNRLKSYGTEITDKRLGLFKELYKNEVEINIIDVNEGHEGPKGTRVEIYILMFAKKE